MTAAVEEDAAAAANARVRADQLLAEAEVAAAERLVQAAELEYSSAVQEQLRLSRALGQVCGQQVCYAPEVVQTAAVRLLQSTASGLCGI